MWSDWHSCLCDFLVLLFRLIFIHFFVCEAFIRCSLERRRFCRKLNLIETEIMFVPYSFTVQGSNVRTRDIFIHFFCVKMSNTIFRCLVIHMINLLRFRSHQHCTGYTRMRSEENRCERAIDTTKTTKRKQTTNCLHVYHMDAESNAELFRKRNEERWPKSFTFDGASVGNWICIGLGVEH